MEGWHPVRRSRRSPANPVRWWRRSDRWEAPGTAPTAAGGRPVRSRGEPGGRLIYMEKIRKYGKTYGKSWKKNRKYLEIWKKYGKNGTNLGKIWKNIGFTNEKYGRIWKNWEKNIGITKKKMEKIWRTYGNIWKKYWRNVEKHRIYPTLLLKSWPRITNNI